MIRLICTTAKILYHNTLIFDQVNILLIFYCHIETILIEKGNNHTAILSKDLPNLLYCLTVFFI